jgi:hypothetical protein
MEPRMNTGAAQPAVQPASARANREAATDRPAFNRPDRGPVAPSHPCDLTWPVTAVRAAKRPDRRHRPIERVSTGTPMQSAAAAPAQGHRQ